MTLKNLQDDLIAEVAEILKDVRTKNTGGKEVAGIAGHPHMLPILQADEDDTAQYFPYFIVRLGSGLTENDDDCWHVAADVILGVHETAAERGHESVLICIQRIVDRFAYDPQFAGRYRVDQKIQWEVQDSDTYPFYFGAVALTISMPKIGRKGEYDV